MANMPSSLLADSIKVSIIIKALNEARNIERCIVSCLQSAESVHSEIILVDSLSTDETVAVASKYPIKIIQLKNESDRSCGVAAQLGYDVARGEYLYIIDGDMELPREFFLEAIRQLDQHKEVAGVGGQLEEINAECHLSRFRGSRARPRHHQAGFVDRLNGGGLYRRNAIESAGGYLTHPGLHAFEELELALRLRQAGWKLLRLDIVSMRHAAHQDSPMALLKRRWRSRYAFGSGELLHSAMGTPYVGAVVREFKLHFAVWLWWIAILATLVASLVFGKFPWFSLVIAAFPFFIMVLRKRSIAFGVYSVVSWNVFSVGMLCGLLGPVRPPKLAIASTLLQDGRCTVAEREVHELRYSHVSRD